MAEYDEKFKGFCREPMENGISMNMVTVEQVAEKLKDKSISNKMISDLLGLMSGNIPIDDIPGH